MPDSPDTTAGEPRPSSAATAGGGVGDGPRRGGAAPVWVRRESRTGLAPPGSAHGLLLVSPDAGTVGALAPEDRAAAVDIGARVLAGAGVRGDDRVVVALNSDGELTGALLAECAVALGATAAATGPRGRMRLHRVLEDVRATTLVATPSGALDLLARLHLEFLVDPLDLGLRRVLLAGEVTDERARRQLATEFDADVVDLLVDPLLQVPVAHRPSGSERLLPARDGLVGLAPLAKDEVLAAPYPDGPAEIVTRPDWHAGLASAVVRTGLVARVGEGAAAMPVPAHTVGELLLVRGRWLSLLRLEEALSRIDGISRWELRVSRAGTLDTAALHVTFARDSLVSNPMWTRRIEQALVGLTPVGVEVVVEERTTPERRPGTVVDARGHHLGRDREAAAVQRD